MSADEPARLGRQILAAYHASGIAARLHRGSLLVLREGGWEGPFDPIELRETYGEEIATLEQRVREAVARCWTRVAHPALDRAIWVGCDLKEADFEALGLGPHAARLYLGVTRSLHYRHALWDSEDET